MKAIKKLMNATVALVVILALTSVTCLAATKNYNNHNIYGYGYKMSPWAQNYLGPKYNPIWGQDPTEVVLRKDVAAIVSIIMNRVMSREGYTTSVSQQLFFSDANHMSPTEQDRVARAVAKGIIIGYLADDGTYEFRPNNPMTRAEGAAVFYRSDMLFFNKALQYNINDQNRYDSYNDFYSNNNNYFGSYLFNDMRGHWAEMEATAMAAAGIFQGKGNGYFDPEGRFSIEELLKVMDGFIGCSETRIDDVAYAFNQVYRVNFGDLDESYNSDNDYNYGTKITSLSFYDGVTSSNRVTLKINEEKTIKVKINPSNAYNQNIDWEVYKSGINASNYISITSSWSNQGYAYVRVKGRRTVSNVTLTGTTRDGSNRTIKAYIYVDSSSSGSDYYDTEITSLSLSNTSITVSKNSTKRVYATINPSTADNKNLIWSSDNTNVAIITNSGISGNRAYADIKGLKAGYSTTIRVETTDGSRIEKTIRVSCNSGGNDNDDDDYYVDRISLSKTQVTIKTGQSISVSATAYPNYANNRRVSVVSDNASVARVTNTDYYDGTTTFDIVGGITGSATIMVSANDDNRVEEYIEVTVKPNSSIDPPPEEDLTAPRVKVIWETSSNISVSKGEKATAFVYTDSTDISSFNLTASNILGLGEMASEMIGEIRAGNGGFYIDFLPNMVGVFNMQIAAGVAVDTSGKQSRASGGFTLTVEK